MCAFWLGDKAYAVETAIVGEVLNVETFIPVPGVPPSILGLFNLRGTPASLVDLRAVLELPGTPQPEPKAYTVLVLRIANVVLTGLVIDRMELVAHTGQGVLSPRDASDDNMVVQGFLELESRRDLVLTVLDSAILVQRLERLKF